MTHGLHQTNRRLLATLLLAYGAASLVHFIHNAEFLPDYPGLPATWTREGVYLAWVGMSGVGLLGWILLRQGFRFAGLALLAVYALLGMDSLAHYFVAPMSAHSSAMNATILVEVGAAALVLVVVVMDIARRLRHA